jgi:endonuclease/exonuclease/phosphatase family metal-dependent hydrolase
MGFKINTLSMTNRLFYSISKLLITGGLLSIQVACATQAAAPDPVNCSAKVQPDVITSPFLSVLTINMAHGRKDSLNQMLQKTSATRRNLEDIAEFLDNSGADLIALQEADFPSRWSGKFDHVDFVSENSNYPCWIHAGHAKKYMYDFGTALMSKVSFTNSQTHTFAPSPPTTNKGFVMGEVRWNPNDQLPEPIAVNVISVHLDFSRKKVREAQVEEMRVFLRDITTPVIIMGDFNADWSKDASALKSVVANGNFRVYQPESNDLGTYKSGKLRLDWILISNHMNFVSYEVPQMVLSDHQPVQATLKLVDFSDKETDSN